MSLSYLEIVTSDVSGYELNIFFNIPCRSSIPVDATGVALDYGLTSYEGKLGDPKPEEPLILSGRPPVEPEKIKDAVKAGTEKVFNFHFY